MIAEDKSTHTFKPITLSLTFETKAEAEAYWAVHNHPVICRFLRDKGIEPLSIRENIGDFENIEVYKELNSIVENFS